MDDLISRKVAIDEIRTMQTYKLFVGDDMLLVDQAEAMTNLMMMPIAEPKWIPVSERLPEEDTEVLVCSDANNIEVASLSRSTEIEGAVIWLTSGWRFGKVTAWMPLPEPYKGE